jgi:hypothetical protein
MATRGVCVVFFFLQKGKEEDTQEQDSEDSFFDCSITIFMTLFYRGT